MTAIIDALLMGAEIQLPTEGYYATIKSAIEAMGFKLLWSHNAGENFVTYKVNF